MPTTKFIITKVHMDLPGVTKEPVLFQGLFKDDTLVEVQCKKDSAYTPLDTICIGRVENIVPSMGGAFLRIAPDELAYLPLSEGEHGIFSKKNSEKGLCIGDELLVQVCKEPIKTKGATLTANLQISGKNMVLSTDFNDIQVSRKIIGDTRKELKNIFAGLKERNPFLSGDREYGIIVRTNAMYSELSKIEKEFEGLYGQFKDLLETGIHKSLYSRLYVPENDVIRRIRDFLQNEHVEIVTDIPSLYEEITASETMGENHSIRLYEDNYSLDKLYSVSSNLEKALSTKVWLKSGAYIVIEPTEALTVIDVNSGKNIKKGNSKQYYLDINLEAAKEILYQIQLRNISGIIVIDFIDMPDKEQQKKLIEHLMEECKKQRIPTSFVEMTKLNLAHIIRKKIQQSLREQVKE